MKRPYNLPFLTVIFDAETQVTFSQMLEDKIEEQQDWEKIEIRNYQKALKLGMEKIKIGYPLTERLIRDMHIILMENARGSTSTAGEYRRIQNFIGPSNNIKDASYIPPEPHLMAKYMTNLERYINGNPYEPEKEHDSLHPLIKAAIIHAQFESIHPFLDGNGRLGRILIVLYLLQSKIIDTPFFFISEELERERFKYYALLNGVRLKNFTKRAYPSYSNLPPRKFGKQCSQTQLLLFSKSK